MLLEGLAEKQYLCSVLAMVLTCVSVSLSDLEWSAGILSHGCTSTLTYGTSAGLGTVEGVGRHELDKLRSCETIFYICWLVIDLSVCVNVLNVQLILHFCF